MGILDNINKKLLNRKVDKNHGNRKVEILSIEKTHNILIVINNFGDDLEIKNHLQLIFQKSKVTSLSFRNEKVDNSNGFFYSFHPSDIGLGKIKNERLIGLINTNFDLVIDFVSEPTELDYFVQKTNSSLKVGDLHSSKNYLYDLLLERGNSYSDFIKNIESQIKLLSND
jgi:hypothetical protein